MSNDNAQQEQKKRFKYFQSRIAEIKNSLPPPLPRSTFHPDYALLVYKKGVIQELELILSKSDADKIAKLKVFFQKNATRIRGSAADYTNPGNIVNLLLFEIAEYISELTHEPALKILLPDLHSTYESPFVLDLTSWALVPKPAPKAPSFFWQAMSWVKSFVTNDHIESSSTIVTIPDPFTLPLARVFASHRFIKMDGHLHLAPVNLTLLSALNETGSNPIVNPYWNSADIESFESEGSISPEEIKDFANHSPCTERFYEAWAAYDQLLNQESGSLFEVLMRFCQTLKYNGAHGGIGQQLDAASGGYDAIIKFHAYYQRLPQNKIPSLVKKQIEYLFALSENPEKNKKATEQIETCIATHSEKLLDITHKNKNALQQIYPIGEKQKSAVDEARQKFTSCREVLRANITSNFNHGNQFTDVTPTLLSGLGVLQIRNKNDLNIFLNRSSGSVKNFFKENPELISQIADCITSPTEFWMLFPKYSAEHWELLLNNTRFTTSLITRNILALDTLPRDWGKLNLEKSRLWLFIKTFFTQQPFLGIRSREDLQQLLMLLNITPAFGAEASKKILNNYTAKIQDILKIYRALHAGTTRIFKRKPITFDGLEGLELINKLTVEAKTSWMLRKAIEISGSVSEIDTDKSQPLRSTQTLSAVYRAAYQNSNFFRNSKIYKKSSIFSFFFKNEAKQEHIFSEPIPAECFSQAEEGTRRYKIWHALGV